MGIRITQRGIETKSDSVILQWGPKTCILREATHVAVAAAAGCTLTLIENTQGVSFPRKNLPILPPLAPLSPSCRFWQSLLCCTFYLPMAPSHIDVGGHVPTGPTHLWWCEHAPFAHLFLHFNDVISGEQNKRTLKTTSTCPPETSP